MLSGTTVTLRPVRPDDLEQMYVWRIDLATWGDQTEEAPWPLPYAAYQRGKDEAALTADTGVTFAIEVAGTLVGRCGMFSFDHVARNAEVGLGLGPDHRGKGYGREVLGLLLDYGFTYRNLHRVWLQCSAGNGRAIRCYTAAGFVEEGRMREHAWINGAYVDMVRMAVLRRDWEGTR